MEAPIFLKYSVEKHLRSLGEKLGLVEPTVKRAERLRKEADPTYQAVKSALEDPEVVWKTVYEVAEDVGITPNEAHKIIRSIPGIKHSNLRTLEGFDLWTTAHHYRRSTRWQHRLVESIASFRLG